VDIAKALESCLTQRTAVFLLRQFHLWGTLGIPDPDVAEAAISFSKFGQRLSTPWTVVICGEPNVGKSSLINALAGYERAIVHSMAGTTRDLVTQNTAIDGWPVELTDSAGIRDAGNEIEQAGILKAHDRIKNADLVLHVTDATRKSTFELGIESTQNYLLVANKVDLCSDEPKNNDAAIFISAKTGQGIEELQLAISRALVPRLPPKGQLVPVSSTQLEFLCQIANRE
jgi:tRNA modification GTPase